MGAERIRFGYKPTRAVKATQADLIQASQGQAVKCPSGHVMKRLTTTHGKRDELYCEPCNLSKPLFNHE